MIVFYLPTELPYEIKYDTFCTLPKGYQPKEFYSLDAVTNTCNSQENCTMFYNPSPMSYVHYYICPTGSKISPWKKPPFQLYIKGMNLL